MIFKQAVRDAKRIRNNSKRVQRRLLESDLFGDDYEMDYDLDEEDDFYDNDMYEMDYDLDEDDFGDESDFMLDEMDDYDLDEEDDFYDNDMYEMDYDLDEEDDFYDLDEEDDFYDLDEEDDFYDLDEMDDYDLDEEDDFYDLDEEDDFYDLDEMDDYDLDEDDDMFGSEFGNLGERGKRKRKREGMRGKRKREGMRGKRKREGMGLGSNHLMRENAELKQTLQEMSTHNAKLLYTVKLIQERKLTSSEQKRIVEAFDNARNVNEVKRVYSTLKGKTSRGTNLHESASNAIKFKNVYKDGLLDAQRSRIQQLAGL